eukprot:scaffold372223_cov31-Prasinocladus_malaysianus.AAC.1
MALSVWASQLGCLCVAGIAGPADAGQGVCHPSEKRHEHEDRVGGQAGPEGGHEFVHGRTGAPPGHVAGVGHARDQQLQQHRHHLPANNVKVIHNPPRHDNCLRIT